MWPPCHRALLSPLWTCLPPLRAVGRHRAHPDEPGRTSHHKILTLTTTAETLSPNKETHPDSSVRAGWLLLGDGWKSHSSGNVAQGPPQAMQLTVLLHPRVGGDPDIF